ncbi:head-tail connector protein [Castellaniella ginsengisoli]|uniref:Head-tail connector protein n=1 Tax=Castellaniella ginsengisoli TaxID=546114 RepID=A0AB39ET79_9BURK
MIPIELARNHLRVDGSDDDDWLNAWIPIVSDAVLRWLKEPARAYEQQVDSNGDVVVDSNGDPVPQLDSSGPILKKVVQAAILIELASQYRFRDGKDAGVTPGQGYILCERATSILASLRRPTLG